MAALTHPRPRNGTRPSNGQPDSLITWTTTPTKSEPILADAPDGVSTYLQAGWSIIPASIEGKRGLVPWKRYQQAPPSPEQFTSWAHRWPRCNWAIITGRLSGVVAVDVDPRAGGDRALAELEQRHGDLPWSAVVETPSGGAHVYLRHPGGRITNSQSRIGLGVDVRGDGGLALLPPSRRPDGSYRWAIGDPGSVPPMPKPWAELLRPAPGRATSSTRSPLGADFSPDTSRRLAGILRALQRAPEGQRNSTLFWGACRLGEMITAGAPAAWADVLVRAGVEAGLEPGECRDTVASGLGRRP